MDLTNERIIVTGGAGFLGRFVRERLLARGVPEDAIFIPRRADYDLTQLDAVTRMYDDADATVVIHLAAEVGGIGANRDHPGRFFYANAAMGLHLIDQGRKRGMKKFVQTGTVCAYPKHAPIPFKEEDLWNGFPEETNAPYGVAKKALFTMLEAYRAEYGMASAVVVPVNLYGPHDNFDLETSHVIPGLIRKCCEAADRHDAELAVWGTGTATREFLYVEDAAEGIVAAAERVSEPTPINLGTGREVKIRDLVGMIVELTGFEGEIAWDASKPDGQPRRCLDTSKAESMMNWKAGVRLEDGLERTIDFFRRNQGDVREVTYGRKGKRGPNTVEREA
ncbi:GDP-L-fucose synthase [Phycisphaera mikurensis]|nr:GDP-L-fucose synthase [Phycisphaera mikurensis]MBB6443260.1 GDP-L-fucose synthase [Phycisphaera mikurensis]